MKHATNISIFLNLALLGLLGFLLYNGTRPTPGPPAPVAATATVTATQGVTHIVAAPLAAPVSTPVPPKPFQWNQLYAKDYHVYVKNLRAIGCPAPVLRAIVAADVHAAIELRADVLNKELSGLDKSSWSSQLAGWSTNQALKAEILRLPDEEVAMLADYLGEKPTSGSVELAHQAANSENSEPIVAPLFAQPVDLAALNLNADQLQAIKDLRQEFMQKVGGPGHDPGDPEYQARWRAAQLETDGLMQGMLGNQAYEDYRIQADIQAAGGKTGPSSP